MSKLSILIFFVRFFGIIHFHLAVTAHGSGNVKNIIVPRNENQILYARYLADPNIHICIGVGSAGTGKTAFACHSAMNKFDRGLIVKIVLTRPLVSVHKEDIGFLPGNIRQKLDPWVLPMWDIFLERWSQKELEFMLKSGTIEIAPLGFMRGRTFKRSFIIADEVQNASPQQVMMLTTRLGEESKLVITGDIHQSDYGSDNGLQDLLMRLNSYERFFFDGIRVVRFLNADVERSPIVKQILELYKKPYTS